MVAIIPINKKILITSALPYVNNVPHLGNLIGCVLSADVFARFQRSAGRDVLYICGTDEHGTTTETKAKEENLTPKEVCDKYFKIHKEIYDWFNIKFDHFGRTSTENHVARTQELFKFLDNSGFILEQTIKQLYSEESKTFLADRYVEGTCPHCNYEDARGDQCDNCGKLLTPTDLINPRSKLDGSIPIIKETTHLFLDLEKLQDELEHWVESQSKLGNWTENAIKITKAWFKEGLKPRAITRDLKWGVPVPKPGYENKVFYVWFDAPIGYISITEQLLQDGWKDWWKAPDDVKLYQFMGKDNIPFHTILFPGTILGSREKYTLLYHINSTEYLNYEDMKFSKSRGTGVFGDNAKESGIPADVFRYYMLMNRPENADTRFMWDEFKEKLNNELVAALGNLVNRTTTFIKNQLDGNVNETPLSESNLLFWDKIKTEEQKLTDLLEEVKIKEALKQLMHISRLGNQFFQEEAPWKSIKEDKKLAEESLFILINLVKDLAIMMEPFMPKASEDLFIQLNSEIKTWQDLGNLSISGDIGTPKILFEKIDDKKVKELKARYGGQKDKPKAVPNNSKNKSVEKLVLSKLDLRVAKITKVTKHPEAEKLYIEELDLGELGTRTIISGLVPYYTAEELEGKHIIVVANLAPAKLRGIKSEGMLLAAEDQGKVKVIFTEAAPGTRVEIENIELEETPKSITIDQFFSLKYSVKNYEVLVEGKKLLLDNKPVKSELENGQVR